MGVILTGMGDDGARCIKEMHETGAVTIAQDKKSSVVWGMPGEAIKHGGIDYVLPLPQIANKFSSTLSNNPIYINGYNQGFAEGMALCQKSPRACGISINATIGGITEEEIKADCRLDPASCGIETENAEGSAEEGIAQCQNDPKSCGIDVEQNIACMSKRSFILWYQCQSECQ